MALSEHCDGRASGRRLLERQRDGRQSDPQGPGNGAADQPISRSVFIRMPPQYGRADGSQPTGQRLPPGGFPAGTSKALAKRDREVQVHAGVDRRLVHGLRHDINRTLDHTRPVVAVPVIAAVAMMVVVAVILAVSPVIVARLGARREGENRGARNCSRRQGPPVEDAHLKSPFVNLPTTGIRGRLWRNGETPWPFDDVSPGCGPRL